MDECDGNQNNDMHKTKGTCCSYPLFRTGWPQVLELDLLFLPGEPCVLPLLLVLLNTSTTTQNRFCICLRNFFARCAAAPCFCHYDVDALTMIMTNDNERRKGKSVCSGVDDSIDGLIGRSSVSQCEMADG